MALKDENLEYTYNMDQLHNQLTKIRSFSKISPVDDFAQKEKVSICDASVLFMQVLCILGCYQ